MRKLSLKKETVAELTSADLDAVVGAAAITKQTQCFCSDLRQCLPTDIECPTYDACFTTYGCA